MTLAQILTPRQMEVVKCVSEGCSNQEIGTKLGVSRYTAKLHLQRIYERVGYGRYGKGSSREPRILLAIRYDREAR